MHRTDKNHVEIMNALRACRYTVYDMSAVGGGMPDLLVMRGVEAIFIEIKANKTDATVSRNQIEWMVNHQGHCGVAFAIENALEVVRLPHRYGVTRSRKSRLIVWLAQNPETEKISMKKFIEIAEGKK